MKDGYSRDPGPPFATDTWARGIISSFSPGAGPGSTGAFLLGTRSGHRREVGFPCGSARKASTAGPGACSGRQTSRNATAFLLSRVLQGPSVPELICAVTGLVSQSGSAGRVGRQRCEAASATTRCGGTCEPTRGQRAAPVETAEAWQPRCALPVFALTQGQKVVFCEYMKTQPVSVG